MKKNYDEDETVKNPEKPKIKNETVKISDEKLTNNMPNENYEIEKENNSKQIEGKSEITKNEHKTIKQFLLFLAFSLGAGVIEFVSFTLITLIDLNSNVVLVIAEILSVVFSCTFNCLINRKFTFKSDRNVYVGLIAYVILYGIMTPLGAWFIVALKNAGVSEFIAKAIKMIINFCAEFCFDKFFLFKRVEKSKSDLQK